MSVANTNLNNYNHELVECIEDLRRKRGEIDREIEQEQEDKIRIEREIVLLQERLKKLNESLAQKQGFRAQLDKTIMETEGAYTKILESAHTLLHVLKRESVHLNRHAQPLNSNVNEL